MQKGIHGSITPFLGEMLLNRSLDDPAVMRATEESTDS
jgi:hypothetical protein